MENAVAWQRMKRNGASEEEARGRDGDEQMWRYVEKDTIKLTWIYSHGAMRCRVAGKKEQEASNRHGAQHRRQDCIHVCILSSEFNPKPTGASLPEMTTHTR